MVCFIMGSFIPITASIGINFEFLENKKRQRVDFELINNLIVLPVEVNGQKLYFLLDSGVNTTLIFNNNQLQNPNLDDAKQVMLQGLGDGNPILAHITTGNTLKIKHLVAEQQTILLIDETEFEFAKRMGTQIDGILGYSLFSSVLITVNYEIEQIKFQKFGHKPQRICRRCYEIPIEIHENKPYIELLGKLSDHLPIEGKFLVDSGSGDSLWLFPDSEAVDIIEPVFEDFLGRAINGNIFGQRGKIHSISIGEKIFKGVKVAYPNEDNLKHLSILEGRVGSIGGEILRRFRVTFDYQNKKIYFKPIRRHQRPFYYNMSGLQIQHNGVELIRTEPTNHLSFNTSDDPQFSGVEVFLQPQFQLALIPIIEIFEVRPESPAARAGIQPGDILKRINGTPISRLKISDVIHKLQKKPGQKLRIVVERKNRMLKFNFVLEPLFG